MRTRRKTAEGGGLGRILAACVLAGVVAGCSMAKEYKRPQVEVPENWLVQFDEAGGLADKAWWEGFRDPALDNLINEALTGNRDLRMATARVEQYAALMQMARSGLYPQVGYGALATSYQRSQNATTFLPRDTDRRDDVFQLLANVSWELDIWGRLRNASEAARAELLAQEEGRQAVIMTLVSEVASNYIALLALDSQLETARRTLAAREEFLRTFEKKFEGGQISNLELTQVRAAYEEIAGSIPALEEQAAFRENALSVLLGRNPGPVERGKTIDGLAMPEVPQGLPSEILERRPDIRQAEQELIAANARIGAARALYFPSISLTGLLGYASDSLSDLLDGSSNLWLAGAEAAGRVFTGGRIKGEVRLAEARKEELLNRYAAAVQSAFREVNDSLTAIRKRRELLEIQTRHASALRENVRYAHSRYDAGYAGFIEIVFAERSLFLAELEQAQTRAGLFAALAGGYKAMGGGWGAEAAKGAGLSAGSTQTGGR